MTPIGNGSQLADTLYCVCFATTYTVSSEKLTVQISISHFRCSISMRIDLMPDVSKSYSWNDCHSNHLYNVHDSNENQKSIKIDSPECKQSSRNLPLASQMDDMIQWKSIRFGVAWFIQTIDL